MKVATCIEPSCWLLVEPATVIDTTPSLPIVSEVALVGIVIAGITWIAARRHELALRVGLERTVAGVGGRAVGHLHLEEALRR